MGTGTGNHYKVPVESTGAGLNELNLIVFNKKKTPSILDLGLSTGKLS